MKITNFYTLLSIVAVFSIAACSPQQQEPSKEPSKESSQSSYKQAKEATKAAVNDVADMSRDAMEEAGDYLNDSAITARVQAALWKVESLRDSTINVETINGTVVLSGVATDDDARELAEQIAAGVEGVKDVENDIEIEH